LFESLFEGLIGFHDGGGGIAQTMALAGLMRHTGKNVGGGQQQRLLIITDEAANLIAQRLDGLEHAALQGLVIGGQQGRHLQHQAELQFPHDIQGRVALLGLEGIQREKKPVPPEVRGVLGQAQGIRAAQQDKKDADQVQDFALRDRQATFLREHFMDLRHGPTFPEPPVANLDDDLQRKTAAAHGQRFRFPRGKQAFPFRLWALRVAASIADADDQVAPTQKDNVLAPQRIGAFQNLTTTWTVSTFGSIVAFANFAIILRSSHRHTSLALGSRKSPFYLTRG
jgi:hypothetical protein